MQQDKVNLDLQSTTNANNDISKKSKKNAKNNTLVPINQEVVFQIINSINLYTQDEQQIQNKADTNVKVQGMNQKTQFIKKSIIELNTVKKAKITQFLIKQIKSIPFNGLNELTMTLRSVLAKIYLKQLTKTAQKQTISEVKMLQDQLNQSVQAYIQLTVLLKQCSITLPLQQRFYYQYSNVWKKIQESLIKSYKERLPNQQYKLRSSYIFTKLFSIWLDIPSSVLKSHLQTFNLKVQFSSIEQKQMTKQLISLLVDLKVQQCCTYYQLYYQIRNSQYYSPQQENKLSDQLRQFQDQVLIPKITKSQQIFSPHVLSLLKSNIHLKNRLLNSNQLSPAVGMRVVDLLKQDGRDYYNIYMYILKQNYKSILYDYKAWYMVEDKLSFNKNFIEWYTEELKQKYDKQIKLSKKYSNNESLQLNKSRSRSKNKNRDESMVNSQNIKDIRMSILKRNLILHSKHQMQISNINQQFKYIQNPLYQYDRFQCAQIIIKEVESIMVKQNNQTHIENKQKQQQEYIRLINYGFKQCDIHIIDKIDQNFQQMCETLLKYQNKPIGFDTQFRCISTKYQKQGVSIIQLSTQQHHYIIDFLKIQHQQKFKTFIIQLLSNQQYIKIGHTISSDIKYLTLTLHIPQDKIIKSFFDLCVIFKSLHPLQKYSSLTFLCQYYLNKKLSKYQQRSNWNRRPLKKMQLHYAVLDAYTCVLIYNLMIKEKSQKVEGNYNIKKQNKINQNKQINQNKLINYNKQIIQNKNEIGQFKYQLKQPQIKIKNQQIQFNIQQTNNNIRVKKYINDIYHSDLIVYHKKYQYLLNSNKQPRFLVDNMLKKLSSILRNCGIDAEYISIRDYNLAIQISQKQQRIILTRDTKFFNRKQNKIPIYMIKQKTDSHIMFQQIVQYFKIDLYKFKTLSRCVKCNSSQLVIISVQEAKKQIKFTYEDNPINQFWRCMKCKQIYWEGGQYMKAKEKYSIMKQGNIVKQ